MSACLSSRVTDASSPWTLLVLDDGGGLEQIYDCSGVTMGIYHVSRGYMVRVSSTVYGVSDREKSRTIKISVDVEIFPCI